MTTIQSLLQPLNLNRLVPALSRLRQADPLPFYLLKLPNAPQQPIFSRASIALSRRISNESLQQHPWHFSIWSPHHLQRLLSLKTTRIQERVILKNPYKSQELIVSALQAGVTQMVVDCPEEIHKIEAIGRQMAGFKNKNLKFLWLCGEEMENGEDIARMEGVKGLSFQWADNTSGKRIDTAAASILKTAQRIEQIVCSGNLQNMEELKQWQREPLVIGGKRISKLVEVTDISDVDNFVLATRNLSTRSPLIDPAAQQLLQGINYHNDSLLVRCGKEEWLVSRISQLPLDEETFLFNWERPAPQQQRGLPQMISL